MLLPKRVKYRRVQRGRRTGIATRGNKVSNGEYGLQALEAAWIKSNQIEAARIAMTRYIKRGGQVWIKIFPDKPVTDKPLGVRMGSGKGAPEYWVAVVKPGRVCLRSPAFLRRPHARLCVLQCTSSRLSASLLRRKTEVSFNEGFRTGISLGDRARH